jgi:hypothetical protein
MSAAIAQTAVRTTRGQLLRVALANSVGFSTTTAVPLWIGTIASHLGVPASWPSVIASLQLACAAAGNITGSIMFRNQPAPKIGLIAAVTGAVGYMLAAIPNAATFAIGCALSGAALGVLLSATNRIVATTDAVHKGYSLVMIVEVAFAVSFYMLVPLIIRELGLMSLFVVLMVLAVTAAAMMLTLIRLGTIEGSGTRPRAAGQQRLRPLLVLLAFSIFFSGQSAVWSRILSVGELVGLGGVTTGRVMAGAALTGLCGALLAGMIGERFGVTKPLLVSGAALAGILLITVYTHSPLVFGVSATTIMLVTMFTVPYVFTTLARFDTVGRWASAGPAFLLIGTAIGPSVAAYTLTEGTFLDVGHTAAALVVTAAAMFGIANAGEQHQTLRGDR